jgi:hypothetical protein
MGVSYHALTLPVSAVHELWCPVQAGVVSRSSGAVSVLLAVAASGCCTFAVTFGATAVAALHNSTATASEHWSESKVMMYAALTGATLDTLLLVGIRESSPDVFRRQPQ